MYNLKYVENVSICDFTLDFNKLSNQKLPPQDQLFYTKFKETLCNNMT